jgi:CheY-like chemotaxis protein
MSDVRNRKMIGEIFVENRILSAVTVERMVALAKKLNRRFGALLEDVGLVTGEELAKALAIQHGCQVVQGFGNFSFSREMLDLIPADVALQHQLFPLKLTDKRLALAMADPTDMKIANNISANLDLTIIPYVATRREIDEAVSRHYFGKTAQGEEKDAVLIVDDDKAVMDTLVRMLDGKYRVMTAMDGIAGFRETILGKPQVIITDKNMPKFDGYHLFDALKNNPETRRIPLILVTSANSPEEEARAFQKGFFDFIPKPVKELVLQTRVNRALQHYKQMRFLLAD